MKAGKWMRCLTFALAAMLLCPVGLKANNIRIIGTPEVKKKSDGKTAAINFTLAWDNSWKSSKPANWDAAWIYVKCWDGDQWNHAYLEEKGHTPGNPDLPGYRVYNRDKSRKQMPMTYEVGKSVVWKKWHLNPEEDSVVGVVGIFLFRKDSLGSGDVVIPGISLLWDYSEQGFVEDDDLVVKVFAVEMVYVPKGSYYLGGKGTAASQVASFTTNGTTFGFPMYVTSEKAITIANDADETSLWSIGGILAGKLPEDFPKGFQAFYIMKYELTQEAYCDFLNTLNQGQQDGRVQGALAGLAVNHSYWSAAENSLIWYRNNIEITQRAPTVLFGVDANNNNVRDQTTTVTREVGTEVDTIVIGIDGQDLPVNLISMYDLLAYADFAGLRPMTELEYEKACRGDRPVVNDEYAWGSVTKTWFGRSFHINAGSATSWNTASIYNINRGDEVVPAQYNCGITRSGTWQQERTGTYWWDFRWRYRRHWWAAPLRVGCFADSTSTRAAAGATYWGVMNMSDNVSELCISAGNTTTLAPGRRFTGVHGDGQLLANGNANVEGWSITDTAAYYIPRGMIFPTYQWDAWCGWTAYYRDGGRDWSDRHAAYRDYDQLAGADLNAGMVSARTKVNHAIPGTQREWASFMPGIRCVRTAGADK